MDLVCVIFVVVFFYIKNLHLKNVPENTKIVPYEDQSSYHDRMQLGFPWI